MKKAHLIFNPKSGQGAGATLPQAVQTICDELGVSLSLYTGTTAEQFEKQIMTAVDNALSDRGVIIAAGGDGTIRSVIQKAANQDVAVGVVAIGTFNFFARNHNIPAEIDLAVRLALTGTPEVISLASINDNVFLVNASMGIYPQAIKDREQSTRRFGRNRLVVILSSIVSFFNPQRLLNLDMVVENTVHKAKTIMLFIGSNLLQLENLNLKTAACLKNGKIAVIFLKPLSTVEMWRIVYRGITKTLESENNVDSFCASSMTIHTRRKTHDLALDGEIFHLASPLVVKAQSHKLNLVRPK